MDDTVEEFQDHKRMLTSRHDEAIRKMQSMMASHNFFSMLSTPDVRPPRPAISRGQLLPIHCSLLVPGRVHYGRVLRGTLIVEPMVMASASTIIEDEVGGVTKLSIHNFEHSGRDVLNRLREANSVFPRGTKLEIIEPYFKLAIDGSFIVRVDKFKQDVKFVDQLGPRLSEGWCDEGKSLCKKQHFNEAIHCYRRSIDVHAKSILAATLLSNIATSLLQKDDLVCGLLFAVASFVVDGSMFKPYYTAGFILNKLKRKDCAFNCLEQCHLLKAPLKFRQQLAAGLRNSPHEHVAASQWNADILSIVASENAHHLLEINPDASANSMTHKERGNVLFKEKKYDESIHEYCMALRGIEKVAILLNNRAICYARCGNHAEAALHASTAIVINPSLEKAHYWKAISLLQLNHKLDARTCCETAISVVQGSNHLETLRERISCSLEEPGTSTRRNPNLQQQQTELEYEEMLRNGAVSTPFSMHHQLIETLDLSEVPRLDDRVSEFHLEFFHEGNWPTACDRDSCRKLLTRAYNEARGPDLTKFLLNLPQPDPMDLLKRLKLTGEDAQNVFHWWKEAELGSLSPRTRRTYASNVHHSFTNSPGRDDVLLIGTVHVSVGFVDLNGLLCSKFTSSVEHNGPLRWIGYEASAYSIAKTMVLAQMIRLQSDTDAILQVWYSSSWSMKTLRSFRISLKKVMDSTNGVHAIQCSEQVAVLLHHWYQSNVPLGTARSEWLSRHNIQSCTEIANFRRKMDRIALCRYLVSGEVLEGSVGSMVMFALPNNEDGVQYQVSLDEWFLHCLGINTILKEVDSETNIIDAAIRILRKRISELKQRVRIGTVEIEVRQKKVSPDDQVTLAEIRKLSPHSMSWSNLCDYYSNEWFHKMARACSGEHTIHHLYSMNWCTEVNGAHVMDYQEGESRKGVHDVAKKAISKKYRQFGMIAYLHDPPITHPYNLSLFTLGAEMYEHWTEGFFTAANLDDRENRVALIVPIMFDILGRGTCTIYMVYSYNPAAQFNRVHASDQSVS